MLGDEMDRHIAVTEVVVSPPPTIGVRDWDELCAMLRRFKFTYSARVAEAGDGSHVPIPK